MHLWRLTRAPFANLSGEGARLYGGRWNSPGAPIVYTATEASLAVLEVRVHLDLPFELIPDDYVMMTIDTDHLTPEKGPALIDPNACRDYGDQWFSEQRSALLQVPSVIVPESHNMLINTQHPDMSAIGIINSRPWSFDQRLF